MIITCTQACIGIIYCVRACVFACVRACVRVCVRECVRACMRECQRQNLLATSENTSQLHQFITFELRSGMMKENRRTSFQLKWFAPRVASTGNNGVWISERLPYMQRRDNVSFIPGLRWPLHPLLHSLVENFRTAMWSRLGRNYRTCCCSGTARGAGRGRFVSA